MNSMSSKVLVCCFIFIMNFALFNKSSAQVSIYTFAQSTTTYNDISSTGTMITAGDDVIHPGVPIGFNFVYDGSPFTQLAAQDDGNVVLGTAANNNYASPLSVADCISLFGLDLNANTGGAEYYQTIGNSPNRIFIYEWKNMDVYADGNTFLNFQLQLFETSNVVQIVYDTMTPSTISYLVQVGLSGAIPSSDYNDRTTTNNWLATTAGGYLADCTFATGIVPSVGLTYTWTPAPPTPMVYDSSTTVFLHNLQTDPPGSFTNQIIQIKVITTGSLTPFDVTSLLLTTNGCTNAGNDVASAKVYYTGTSSLFSTTTQFGSTVNNPNGAYTVNGLVTLSGGINYFWITYDITSGATMGDTLSGCCTQIVGDGVMGTQIPTVSCPAGVQTVNPQTGFIPVTNLAPHPNGGVMVLLTDGTVVCKGQGGIDYYGYYWDKLTPDANGSYVNGTWSPIDSMTYTRLYFSTQVLKDGRMYVAGGEYGTGTPTSEIYNPLTDSWITLPGTGHSYVDANSEILPNGDILQACEWDNITFVYDPIANTYSGQQSTLGTVDESAWVKFPDSSIVFVNMSTQNSERYIPSMNLWIADGTVPVILYDGISETGPGFLLPDGRAFFLGGSGHTAFYTPSGNLSPGVWAAGPDIPGGNGCTDAAGAMMVNGRILFACNPPGQFGPPTSFYEFDYTTNTYTQVNAPGGGLTVAEPCYVTNMLDLPDGTVLFSQQQEAWSNQYYVYMPSGSPLPQGKPTITNLVQTTCDSFKLMGTLFNGICEGAAYGDDWQMSTNRPIIRFTNGPNVYYARTTNWNSTGVARGNLPDTTDFTIPSGIPHTTYQLVVTANGNASDPILFVPFPIFSSSLTPPAICSGSTFTYSPTTYDTTTTYSWTRAAVAGLSNAAITIPQMSNPNEILTDTTSNPVTVVYQYILTDHGCSDTQLVTVIVNPLPIATITANGPTTFCQGDSVILTIGTFASYHWSNGSTSNNITVNSSATYTVTVTDNNGCSGTASQTIIVNPLPPVPVITVSGDTLHSSASSGNQWYRNTIIINGATNQTYIETQNGSYTVTVTDSNGCSSTSLPKTINVGIDELSNKNIGGLNIYPNPANDIVTISFHAKAEGNYAISLVDMIGRTIREDAGKAVSGDNKLEFSLNTIAKGIYIVELRSGNSSDKIKLVIE